MQTILLVIKGFIMGIANVIPGVSGGTLALILGIYEQFISAISHFLSDIKKNLKFLLPIGIGMVLAIIVLSGTIEYCYATFPLATTLFFVGLVAGGVPMIYQKVKGEKSKRVSNWLIFACTFALVIFMAVADKIFDTNLTVSLANMGFWQFIILFFIGVIASATMVIPGVSGSLVLMLMGYYYPVIQTINEFFHGTNLGHNFWILAVFGIGILFGIVAVSKLIEQLFSKFETKTYYGVFGFVVASIVAIPLASLNSVAFNPTLLEVIISCGCLIIGYCCAYYLSRR